MLVLGQDFLSTFCFLLHSDEKCVEKHKVMSQLIKNRYDKAYHCTDYLKPCCHCCYKVIWSWLLGVGQRGDDKEEASYGDNVIGKDVLDIIISFEFHLWVLELATFLYGRNVLELGEVFVYVFVVFLDYLIGAETDLI